MKTAIVSIAMLAILSLCACGGGTKNDDAVKGAVNAFLAQRYADDNMQCLRIDDRFVIGDLRGDSKPDKQEAWFAALQRDGYVAIRNAQPSDLYGGEISFLYPIGSKAAGKKTYVFTPAGEKIFPLVHDGSIARRVMCLTAIPTVSEIVSDIPNEQSPTDHAVKAIVTTGWNAWVQPDLQTLFRPNLYYKLGDNPEYFTVDESTTPFSVKQ